MKQCMYTTQGQLVCTSTSENRSTSKKKRMGACYDDAGNLVEHLKIKIGDLEIKAGGIQVGSDSEDEEREDEKKKKEQEEADRKKKVDKETAKKEKEEEEKKKEAHEKSVSYQREHRQRLMTVGVI